MLQHITPTIALAERTIDELGLEAALDRLRKLSVADFAELMLSMPNQEFPKLSRALPRMASVETQQNWSGASGEPLLADSATFARILQLQFETICARPLSSAQVLDYGCGYGRMIRLMYRFCSPASIFGVDPMQQSIQICTDDGLLGHIAQSEYLPESLPVGKTKFDLAYAYSVFTHTSHRATSSALSVLRKYLRDDGLLVITIRPIEYWAWHPGLAPELVEQLQQAHRTDGFAFLPHNVAPIDGDIVYGDTSMEPDWIEASFPDWKIRALDRGLDRSQTILSLSPSRRRSAPPSTASVGPEPEGGVQTSVTRIEEAGENNLAAMVKLAFADAMALRGQIDPAVLDIDGMSGRKYRYFINNLIRLHPRPRYLEVGSWAGSTLCSAMSRNAVPATAIDNWSEFGGPKAAFLANVEAHGSPRAPLTFIESDFRKVDYSAIGVHNVFLFDGPHSAKDQYDGIALALPALDDQFVLIVDDWNWEQVRTGTLDALAKLGLAIRFAFEVRSTLDNSHPTPSGRHSDWHNGYFIAVLQQPSEPG